jgi:hypothetical protein
MYNMGLPGVYPFKNLSTSAGFEPTKLTCNGEQLLVDHKGRFNKESKYLLLDRFEHFILLVIYYYLTASVV